MTTTIRVGPLQEPLTDIERRVVDNVLAVTSARAGAAMVRRDPASGTLNVFATFTLPDPY